MAGQHPQDVSAQYGTGTAVTSLYQTSGVYRKDEQKVVTTGQADSFSVMNAAAPLDEAGMQRLMNGLQAEAQAVNNGSTGSIVGISQAEPGPGEANAFDVVYGFRGDSQAIIIKADAQGNVDIVNLQQKVSDEDFFVSEFGDGGLPDENNVVRERIALKPGEKAIVLAATDGMSDAYLGQRDQMRQDISDYLKANPGTADLSRFMAERATALGTEDNTTIVSTVLGEKTSLAGKTAVMAVFDGVGHDDGTLSSALARRLESDLPDGQKPTPIAKQELAHVSLRTDDLARVGTPGTKDPHAEKLSQALSAQGGGSRFAGLASVTLQEPSAPKAQQQKPAAPAAKM